MKNMKLIALLICLTVIVCSFAGCAKTAPLSFELNGGTLVGEAPTEFTNDADLALPTATKQYYSFKGWSLSSDGAGILEGNKLPADMELTDEQVENGLKLYAVWERLTGTINYDLAEGKWNGKEGVSVYNYGETLDLPKNVERENFKFRYWEFNGERYTQVPKDQEGNIELVAVWEQVKTKINFVLLNDEAAPLEVDEYFDTQEGCDLTEEEYIPTASGFFFAGWYLSEDDANNDTEAEQVTKIDEGTTEEVTLYAKWVKAPTIEDDNWVPTNK